MNSRHVRLWVIRDGLRHASTSLVEFSAEYDRRGHVMGIQVIWEFRRTDQNVAALDKGVHDSGRTATVVEREVVCRR